MRKSIITIIVISLIGILIEVISYTVETGLLSGLSIFRYFTIQSNTIVFLYFSGLLIFKKPDSKYERLIGGVTIYITITFLVFLIFLQPIYHPTGLRAVGNIFVHYLTPISVILYMVYNRNKFTFTYSDVYIWIIYPVLYVLFLVTHGIITNDYLYPFFQVSEVGVVGLSLSIVLLVLFFLVLSLGMIKLSKIGQE